MLRFYSLMISLAVWTVLLPFQLLKLVSGKSSWDGILQRMAWIRSNKPSHYQSIVIHAVSYGEMMAIEPIITSLADNNPNLELILTTGNSDGMMAGRSLQSRYPNIVKSMFLPWDRSQAIKHWLTTLEPDLLVIMETEIWPNLLTACSDLGIPVCIVNGRIYPGDVGRYRLIRRFMKNIFSRVDWIGVQDESEYHRFLAIGAPAEILEIVGNIKYDQLTQGDTEETPWLSRIIEADASLLVAGSTHAPEEDILLEAFKALKLKFPDLRLILAPRKVSRVAKIEKLATRYHFQVMRSSTLETSGSSWDVLLVDELGKLSRLYGLADIVFVGGSLANRGGHNLLEAATHGKPIIVGPHMQHFQGIVEEFERKNALVWLNGKNEMENVIGKLLADPVLRSKMGEMALAVVSDNKGCSQHYVQSLVNLMAGLK